MVGTRGNRISISPWVSLLVLAREEERRKDEVGYISKRIEKADSQGQLSIDKYSRNPYSLQGTTVFSSLDACRAYHAVRIEPGSHAFTAFISPFGTFKYTRMPFGLANDGSLAMKDVDRDFWTSYLDDILTFS